jgi:hypothetical protein
MVIKDLHILILIGIIVITAGGAVWGTIKFAIPNLKEGLGKVQKEFAKEIERIDGNCLAHRESCQALLCGRIDEIKIDLKGMDRLRERARLQTVSRGDFEDYKEAMKAEVKILAIKMDKGAELLTRLDERVLMLLKANGINTKG